MIHLLFQCIGISAQDVAEDLHHYTRGHFHKVRPGRRGPNPPGKFKLLKITSIEFLAHSNFHPHHQYPQKHPSPPQSFPPPHQQSTPRGQIRDDISAESSSTEYFEMDVNTLNRCFDDIERFVARIQSAAIAQRELEIQQRNKKRGSKKG
jgi:epidermal growth factor receptor kinase substrate 8